jgi:glycosyltransferase involved in cell wall biosynthesis
LARQQPTVRRVKGLIAISDAMEAEIRLFPALQTIPLHRIYDAYVPAQPGLDSVRARGRIACVGRVVAVKGQDVLLQALSIAEDYREPVECLIVGDGDDAYIHSLKALGQRVGANARWLGFVGDILPLLRTCAVLVCPSHREPLGRVIFEAWDAGVLPVVYAGAGGSAEIVSAADGGILYEEQSPTALARALVTALALGDSQTAHLIENGRSWMAAHCGAKKYGRAILTVFSGASDGSKDL